MKKYKTLIIISVLIAMGVIYFYYLSSNNKTEKKKADTSASEIQELINKDLEKNYPATPKEVVELYSRYLICFYGDNCDEDELVQLAAQSVKLFDDELKNKNPFEEYIENLKADILQYKKEKKKISTYIVENSGDIEFKTFQSHYYANVECVYYIKGKGVTSRTLETYTLRKDSTGKWKILYWSLTPTN